MKTIFVVEHLHDLGEGREDIKLIGVYSSRRRADESVARMSALPGFRDAPTGFFVEEYEIDTDHWIEGFVTVG